LVWLCRLRKNLTYTGYLWNPFLEDPTSAAFAQEKQSREDEVRELGPLHPLKLISLVCKIMITVAERDLTQEVMFGTL
jgi:hypothetical protein